MKFTADYQAQKISESITINGDIDKKIWRNAIWSKRFVDMETGEAGLYNTQTAILWSDSHLYIAFRAEEPFIEAHLTERDSIIFLENDLEVLINGDDCYYELEVNALNTVYEVFLFGKMPIKKWKV
ncbi:MAG: carbohydrate-binding family 9-like protein [Spirosomataceae bacterium]